MKFAPSLLASLVLGISAFAQEQILFNGKDLTGWEGNTTLWSVRDGVIHGETVLDPARAPKSTLRDNSFLVWKDGTPGDFELHLKFRLPGTWSNSGVQFRSKVMREGVDGPIVAGYQADIDTGPIYSGILYEERGAGILAKCAEKVLITSDPERPKHPVITVTGSLGSPEEIQATMRQGEWNEYVIIAKGNHIQQFLNGKQTVDVIDERKRAPKDGVIALQLHQQEPMVVEFKDIVLKSTP